MRPVHCFLVLALLAVAVAPVNAQGLTQLDSGDGPLEVFADDGIEWQRDRKIYVARGNAVARRGDVEVRADTLTAFYREGQTSSTEIYRIDALGNVVVESPNERAYGDRGIYLVDDGVVQLLGDNLKLETPEDVITARDSLEYWEDYNGSPLAVARGDAVAQRPADKQRIRAEVITAILKPGENGNLEIDQVDAFGNVRISTEKEYARGDRGTYFVKDQVALLEGNVKITSEENQLNGERAELDLKTGVSRLLASSSDQVRGLLVPRKDDSAEEQEQEAQ